MRVSVVIPAYDAERHLEACVRSVLDQPWDDIEVICVNDGSTDATEEVMSAICASDDRVMAVSQANAGVSAARNAGLRMATGEVVMFVDADDRLLPDVLDLVVAQFNLHRPDCVVFGLVIDPPEAAPITLSHRLTPRNAVYAPFDPKLIFDEYTHPYAVRTVFRREFLIDNHIGFSERLTLGEDEAFLMTAYRLSRKTVLSSLPIYCYLMDSQSASHRDNSSDDVLPQKLDKHLELVSVVLDDWKTRGMDASCDGQVVVWALDLLLLDLSRLEPRRQKDFYRRILKLFDDYFGASYPRLGLPARVCLEDLRRIVGNPSADTAMPKAHLIAFYVSTRGIGAVAERAIARMRGRGAY